MFFGYLTLITALSISAVAIYYSVAGLVAIFAAATIPIIIMGSVLEIAKLVTAVWLHKYWVRATWWLRTYLSTAVIVLMFITSMGIFGFLSKAHIEQTTAGQESAAKVQQLTSEIARQEANRSRAEEQVRKLETTGSGADAQIQAQIDKEQERIDNAYKRIQPTIDEQNRIIGSQATLYQTELTRIDEQLSTLQKYIDSGEIKKAQAMIGARQDGQWGSRTAAAAEEWKSARRAQRTELLTKIEQATNNPQARAAANEIKRLRQGVEREIAESNKLINRLRGQVGKKDNAADIQKSIDEQNERIRTASSEIDRLTEEKYKLEGEYRKLEAEVGPIKYIAEFVYGEQADQNMLERAVRWVIITIIFVFDPLAVLLLLAAQYTFEFARKPEEEKVEEDPNDPEPNSLLVEPDHTWPESPNEDPIQPEDVPGDSEPEIQDSRTEEDSLQQVEEVVEEESKKKESSSETVESTERLTEDQLKQLDETEEWQTAKQSWKEDHPNLNLKFFKDLYLQGKIDELPWEKYLKPKSYMMKEDNRQVRKTTESSQLEESAEYIQNEEQKDSTLWKRIRRDNE